LGFGAFAIAMVALTVLAQAAEDRYAPTYTKPLKSSATKDPLSTLIALPFEILRWPMDKGSMFMEKNALPEKAKWIYTYLTDHGIHPAFGGPGGWQGGLKIDIPRLADFKTRNPDFLWDAWLYY